MKINKGPFKVKKGFTLMEIVVVIIIIGVLATLGFQQYSKTVERTRGAEAWTIIGQIRSAAAIHFREHGTVANFDNPAAGIGLADDQIPGSVDLVCRPTHYFTYNVQPDKNNQNEVIHIIAIRCATGGKEPQSQTGCLIELAANLATGEDRQPTNPCGY